MGQTRGGAVGGWVQPMEALYSRSPCCGALSWGPYTVNFCGPQGRVGLGTVEAGMGAVIPLVVTLGLATLPTLALRYEHIWHTGALLALLGLTGLRGGCRRAGMRSLSTSGGCWLGGLRWGRVETREDALSG